MEEDKRRAEEEERKKEEQERQHTDSDTAAISGSPLPEEQTASLLSTAPCSQTPEASSTH